MGRRVNISNGKNVQSRSLLGIPKKKRKAREKLIVPIKMPNTLYEGKENIGIYRYHRRGSYTSQRTGQKTTYLRCYNPQLKCPGKGVLQDDGEFKLTIDHLPLCKDPFIAQKAEYRQALYDAVKATPGNCKNIHESVARKYSIGSQFSSYPKVKSRMLVWRNESQPTLPTCIADITDSLDSEQWRCMLSYSITFAEEESGMSETSMHQLRSWTVWSDIENKVCHVVFGTPTYAQNFAHNDTAFIDCTFDVVPNVFGGYQLLTIMIEHLNEVEPVGWAIMQRKDERAYEAVLSCIKKKLLPTFNPTWGMSDFEPALQNALKTTFPSIDMHGCYFHHCHAILKYRQRLRIMSRIMNYWPSMRIEASGFERDLMNIALLPREYIIEAFVDLWDRLKKNIVLSEIMDPLFQYYESFWIRKKMPNSFSVYNEKRRTNNVIERYHRSLKEEMATKPEFFKFMRGLMKIQEEAHRNLIVSNHGEKPRERHSKKAKIRAEQLRTAWDEVSDLSKYSREQRRNKFITFLNNVRSGTILALDRLSIEDDQSTEAVGLSTAPDVATASSSTPRNLENENEMFEEEHLCPTPCPSDPLCKHFAVGCKVCDFPENNIVPNRANIEECNAINDKVDSDMEDYIEYEYLEDAFVGNETDDDDDQLTKYSPLHALEDRSAISFDGANDVPEQTDIHQLSVMESKQMNEEEFDETPENLETSVPTMQAPEIVNIPVIKCNVLNNAPRIVHITAQPPIVQRIENVSMNMTTRPIKTIPQEEYKPKIPNPNKKKTLQGSKKEKNRGGMILCSLNKPPIK